MRTKAELDSLIVDIEETLRYESQVVSAKHVKREPIFDDDFEKFLGNLQDCNPNELQKFIMQLLETRGPKRKSGKVDTVCFYQRCSISASSWSNFMNGKYTKETILKILAGLESSLDDTQHALELAGYGLTQTRQDRLVLAAIKSNHFNSEDMYDILAYYAEQYPNEVKNYYEANL